MADFPHVSLDEIVAHFQQLEDPRSTVNRRHPLASWSDALLMDKFYTEWRAGRRSVAAALREAQRWMREDIPSGRYVRDKLVTPESLGRIADEYVRTSCEYEAEALAYDHPDTPPVAEPAYWAAFTATGWAFDHLEKREK